MPLKDDTISREPFSFDSYMEIISQPDWEVVKTKKDRWKYWVTPGLQQVWHNFSEETKFYVFATANGAVRIEEARMKDRIELLTKKMYDKKGKRKSPLK